MPLTDKQAALWSKIAHSITGSLRKECSKGISTIYGRKLPSASVRLLFDLVQANMAANAEEDTFFKVAFETFVNELEAQGLNAEQYRNAAMKFSEIPEVSEALLVLKNAILPTIFSIIGSPLERPSSDSNDSDSFGGAGESFSEGSTCLSSSTGTAEAFSPEGKAGLARFGVKSPFPSGFVGDDMHASFMVVTDSPLGMGVADSSFLTEISGSPLPGREAILPVPIKINFASESLAAAIQEWVYERYSPVDERVLTCNERQVRRMDSLARLLSQRTLSSACTAVTIEKPKDGRAPYLVIGANVSRNGEQEEIFTGAKLKLIVIQRYLAEVLARNIAHLDSPTLDELANELVSRLLVHANTSMLPEVLQQAARKIVHAICFDEHTFTKEEKQAFLNPAVVILPLLTARSTYGMIVRNLDNRIGEADDFIDLPMIPRGTNINDIHAEQLVGHYLFKELSVRTLRPFGISKLCCRTCVLYLENFPALVRGHHNQSYPGVVNLYNGMSHSEPVLRRAATHAWPSPGDTPDKSLKLVAPEKALRRDDTDLHRFFGGAGHDGSPKRGFFHHKITPHPDPSNTMGDEDMLAAHDARGCAAGT